MFCKKKNVFFVFFVFFCGGGGGGYSAFACILKYEVGGEKKLYFSVFVSEHRFSGECNTYTCFLFN